MRGHAMWERGEGCPGRRGQSMETGGDCAQPTTKVVEHIRRGGECARGLATHAKCCSKASLAASKFKSSNGRDSKKTVCVVSRREAQEKRERRFRVGSCQTWVQSLDVGHMWRWTTSPFFPFPLPPAAQGKRWGGGGRAHGVPGGQIVPTSAPSMEGASRSGVPRPLVPLPHRPYATTEALGFFLWCALPPSLAGQGRPLFPFSLSCHRVESRETTTVGLSERATCVLATHTPLSPSNIPAACACPRPSCTATHPIYAHRHPASLLPSTRKPQPQPAMGNTSGSLKPGAGGSTHTHTYVATECV